MRGLLDTSIFIADEQDRHLEAAALPIEAAVSVVSLGELELGVHLAETPGFARAASHPASRADDLRGAADR